MPRDERALQIGEDLKLVLGILNMRFPNYTQGETVFKAVLGVSTDYTKQRLIRDITYLNEKGWVKFRGLHGIEAMSISVNHCAFALTAAGYEITNRLISDPALDA